MPLGPMYVHCHHHIPGIVLCPDCWHRYTTLTGWGRVSMWLQLQWRSLTRRR
jgi:hypothetical protein